MIIIDNTDNKITIPVGIGVVQTETVRNFYNTNDSTITSSDILVDKVAYGKYGKVVGNLDLDAEKGTSYTEGYNNGYTIGNEIGYSNGETNGYNNGYNEGIEIGYNDGYSNGESAGYSTGYDEGVVAGYDSGVEIGKGVGRNEIINEQSDATITPSEVMKGYIGYGKDNERIVGESEAITSIDVAASGIKFANSSFSQIPSYYDFDNCVDLSYIFQSCSNLTTVQHFNTSKVTNMSNMFQSCTKLSSVPLFDTSNVTTMYYMFYYCSKLTSVPQFDTSKCLNFNNMFAYCDSLIDVPEFDWSGYKETYGGSEIFGVSYNYAKNIENIGGFKDAGKSYTKSDSYNTYKDIIICYCPKLTHQSCLNVINKVYDMNLNKENTYTPKIRLHSTPYSLLSNDDIAIATNKGWIVQAG